MRETWKLPGRQEWKKYMSAWFEEVACAVWGVCLHTDTLVVASNVPDLDSLNVFWLVYSIPICIQGRQSYRLICFQENNTLNETQLLQIKNNRFMQEYFTTIKYLYYCKYDIHIVLYYHQSRSIPLNEWQLSGSCGVFSPCMLHKHHSPRCVDTVRKASN